MELDVLTKISDMGCTDAKSGQIASLDQTQLSNVFGFLLSKYDSSFEVETGIPFAAQQKKIVRLLGLAELGHHIRDASQVSTSNKGGVLKALGGLIDKLETKFGSSIYAKKKVMSTKVVAKPSSSSATIPVKSMTSTTVAPPRTGGGLARTPLAPRTNPASLSVAESIAPVSTVIEAVAKSAPVAVSKKRAASPVKRVPHIPEDYNPFKNVVPSGRGLARTPVAPKVRPYEDDKEEEEVMKTPVSKAPKLDAPVEETTEEQRTPERITITAAQTRTPRSRQTNRKSTPMPKRKMSDMEEEEEDTEEPAVVAKKIETPKPAAKIAKPTVTEQATVTATATAPFVPTSRVMRTPVQPSRPSETLRTEEVVKENAKPSSSVATAKPPRTPAREKPVEKPQTPKQSRTPAKIAPKTPVAVITVDLKASTTAAIAPQRRGGEKLARTPVRPGAQKLARTPLHALNAMSDTEGTAMNLSTGKSAPAQKENFNAVRRRRISFGAKTFEELRTAGGEEEASEELKDKAMTVHVKNMQEYSTLKEELATLEKKINATQQMREQLDGQLEKIDGDILVLGSERDQINKNLKQSGLFDGDIFNAPMTVVQQRVADVRRKNREVAMEADHMEEQLEDTEVDVTTEENTIENQIRSLVDEQNAIHTAINDTQRRMDVLEVEFAQKKRDLESQIQRDVVQARAKVAALQAEKEKIQRGEVVTGEAAAAQRLQRRVQTYIQTAQLLQQSQMFTMQYAY